MIVCINNRSWKQKRCVFVPLLLWGCFAAIPEGEAATERTRQVDCKQDKETDKKNVKIVRGIKSAAANELNSLSRTAYARDTFQSQYFLAMNFKIVKSAKLPRLFGLLESVSGFCSYSAQAQFSHTPKKKKKKNVYQSPPKGNGPHLRTTLC